jgi:viologen exporter family transport system permease protein
VRFYLHLFRVAVLARLEYRLDLVISIATALVTQASGLTFYRVLFANTAQLNGWQAPDVLLLFGMVALTFAISELFFNGIWSLPSFVVSGRLDRVLISPARSLLYVLLSQPQLYALGNLFAGAGMVAAAAVTLHLPAAFYCLLPLWIISGALTYTALLVILASLGFVILGPNAIHLRLTIQLLNATRYPLGMYPPWMRFMLLSILPLGVGTYFPSAWLAGHVQLLVAVVVPPLVALATCACAVVAWELGLRRYQSAGS